MSAVHDALVGTREFLSDPSMWQKGANGPPSGPCCLRGALARTISHGGIASPTLLPKEEWTTFSAAEQTLSRLVNFSVMDFNDSYKTTHDDVLSLLDRAIGVSA